MKIVIQLPFYAKFALIIVGTSTLMFILYIGQHIILPVIYSAIMAILLNPFIKFLVQKKINRLVAISMGVSLAILVTLGLLYFISVQFTMFSDTYPALKEKFTEKSTQLVQWITLHSNLHSKDINDWVRNTESDTFKNMGGAIGQTLSIIDSIIIIIVLLPVYLFMLLMYKDLLLEFIRKLFESKHHVAVFEVLAKSKKVIQNYLFGLLIEAVIIATLNSLGLLVLGIDYAIILGVTGALLNVIPYIGGVIAIVLPMIIAFVTKESSVSALLVLGLYLLIQFIDNHIIIPRIVASKVKLNALISLIAVITGGALWGIPGMLLSIPLTAILKVIFDHIEPLKPWGYLLGNIVPTSRLTINIRKKRAPAI